jgi:branched-chain amino acid transport system substrate-binding protein
LVVLLTSLTAAYGSTKSAKIKNPKGKPILIGVITDEQANALFVKIDPAINAAVSYINRQLGGVNGRPFQVVGCNPNFDPAATQTCANQIVSSGAVVDIGDTLQMGNCCFTTFEGSNVLYMPIPNYASELTMKNALLMGGGSVADQQATGAYMKAQKWSNVVYVTLDSPVTHGQVAATQVACGCTFNTIYYPRGSADLTTPINQVIQAKPSYVIIRANSPDEATFIKAFTAAGIPASHMITGTEGIDDSMYSAAGSAANGVLQVMHFLPYSDTTDPDMVLFHKVMNLYKADPNSSFAEWPFATVMELYQAAKAIGGANVTAASLKAYFNKYRPPSQRLHLFMMGTGVNATIIPPSKRSTVYSAPMNWTMRVGQYENGTLKTVWTSTTVPRQ